MRKFLSPDFERIVSDLAQFEAGKRQYYRPIYSIHKWWARRPGSLFRAILLSAIESDKPLFSNEDFFTKNSNYYKDHDFSGYPLIVFDPFMGGGTTLVEANRLGLRVVGCDLNPVSYWIVRESLKNLDTKKLEKYFLDLSESVGEKIRKLYETRCTTCHTYADTLYAFWVRYIECPHCGSNLFLFKRTLLNEGYSRSKPLSEKNKATVFCPRCFSLNHWNGKGNCRCLSCELEFDPRNGTYNEGICNCINCGMEKINLVDVMRAGQRLYEKLIAIEYICSVCKLRLYKSPDSEDLRKLEATKLELDAKKNTLIIPNQKILEGDSSVRWRTHNFKYYYEIFNSRQLLAFNYLLQGIKSIPDQEYQNAFITIFSNSLEYNNMMTPYNYPHRKLHHLFNYHALPLTTTPVENSVWGVNEEGAGTFVNCYKRYLYAKEFCQNPFDRYKDKNGRVRTIQSKERISANFVDNFEELQRTKRGAMLLCGNSANLFQIPDKSIDLIVTDPPYYDSIHYSELSNFFYVWLKSILNHHCFTSDHVPYKNEVIVNGNMDKGEKEYQELLTSVFKECYRVLKDNGKLIFTFHHTKWVAWWTVLSSIVDSRFRVIDSFPVTSEYKVNPHIRNKQSLDMDLVIICQKDVVYSATSLDSSPQEIIGRVFQYINHTTCDENRLFLYYMGELLVTASSNVEKINYDWFEQMLIQFNNLRENTRLSDHQVLNENQTYVQKSLF